MKIYKIAKDEKGEEIDIDAMKAWFDKRTNEHIKRVKKYCKKIEDFDSDRFSGLCEQAEDHDQTKFKDPEYDPYLYITWKYKCQDDGKNFEVPKEIEDKMTEATEHHIKSNRHHPEFHCDKETNLINTDDRDKPPEEAIDATKMKVIDVAEMVADWMGVSEERGTSPKGWADKNVNIRWKFTDKQKDLIYELIDEIWES